MNLLEESGVDSEVHGIPIRIRFDGERYFVTDDHLDMYGVGGSPEEAKRDYWLAVQDYYEDLTEAHLVLALARTSHYTAIHGHNIAVARIRLVTASDEHETDSR